MNYIVKCYDDYDPRRYGTPWAVPCDSSGRPNFKAEHVGHFTGGRGKGGNLYVTDPEEFSVWAYGQKDYKGGSTRGYFQFIEGELRPVPHFYVPDAINLWEKNTQPVPAKRKDELLRILFARVADFEEDRLGEAMRADGITKEEAEAYGVTWED